MNNLADWTGYPFAFAFLDQRGNAVMAKSHDTDSAIFTDRDELTQAEKQEIINRIGADADLTRRLSEFIHEFEQADQEDVESMTRLADRYIEFILDQIDDDISLHAESSNERVEDVNAYREGIFSLLESMESGSQLIFTDLSEYIYMRLMSEKDAAIGDLLAQKEIELKCYQRPEFKKDIPETIEIESSRLVVGRSLDLYSIRRVNPNLNITSLYKGTDMDPEGLFEPNNFIPESKPALMINIREPKYEVDFNRGFFEKELRDYEKFIQLIEKNKNNN
jgi:hypothetical protein